MKKRQGSFRKCGNGTVEELMRPKIALKSVLSLKNTGITLSSILRNVKRSSPRPAPVVTVRAFADAVVTLTAATSIPLLSVKCQILRDPVPPSVHQGHGVHVCFVDV